MDIKVDASTPPVATPRAKGPPAKPSGQKATAAPPALVTSSARFSVDADSGLISIKIVNSATGELIRSIPSREYVTLPLSSGTAKGTLLDAIS